MLGYDWSRPVRWVGLVSSLVTLGLGLFMVALPSETEVALGRILGVLLISTGIFRLIETVRHRRRSNLGWGVAGAILLTAAGGLVTLFPAQLISTLIVVTAVAWTTAELFPISVLLRPDRKTDTPATTPELVAQ
ncbi:MAG: uncharacterized membrane protein HdeD (DUF308 family) [Candidatus Aldehydirespiratoraceae bacterium]|jgi:uncharacterized membrane protein HdeD (DUF308 family)